MKTTRNERGFSLLEVLVAMVILSIGLLGVAGMQTTAITGNTFAQSGTVAIQLAEEMVNRIRTNAGNDPDLYDDIDTSGDCTGLSAPADDDCTDWKSAIDNSKLANGSGTVNVEDNKPIDNTATVKVIVQWGGSSGDARSVTFTTILETWGT